MRNETNSQEQVEDILELLDIVDSPTNALEAENTATESPVDKEGKAKDSKFIPQGHSCSENKSVVSTVPLEGQESIKEPETEKIFETMSTDAEESALHQEEKVEFPSSHEVEIDLVAESLSPLEQPASDVVDTPNAPSGDSLSDHGKEPCPTEQIEEALKAPFKRKIQELEERLLATEKARDALAAKIEDLQQQMVDTGTLFFEDARVRLHLEELISRMLDVREGEVAPVVHRLDSLENRIKSWEEQIDRKMMEAAARVIREEIATMRAEGKNFGRG